MAYDGSESFYEHERNIFSQARKALRNEDFSRFERLQQRIADYPLSAYLAYEYLRYQFSTQADYSDLEKIERFRKQHGDSHLADRLVGSLVTALAEQEKWSQYLELVGQTGRSAGQCATLLAKIRTGKLKTFNQKAVSLWVKPQKHPDSCIEAFSVLEEQSPVTVRMVWDRIYQLMDKGRVNQVEALLPYLGSRDRKPVQAWIDGWSDPGDALSEKGAFSKDNELNRRVILSLTTRWAKRDSEGAYQYWQKARSSYLFSSKHRYDLDALIARMAAYDGLEQADRWLHDLPDDKVDQKIRFWRIRTSLREQDWQAVVDDIEALPTSEREDSQWRYWHARAFEQLGDTEAAKQLFTQLADDMSYHGFLAADRLGLPYAMAEYQGDVEAERLEKLAANPVLIRAREYAWAQIPWEGRREWMKEVSGFADDDRYAAAELASQWGWADRAVFTVAKTGRKDALSLRFPMPHTSEVEKASARHAIESAWIYGVMRRESGFISDIRSGAGAVGLMQLMPATAKDVARRQGRKHPGDLTKAENNIRLGSFYLRYVMDTFDNHQILATAAYNAGPNRVKRWLPEDSVVPADIWIDTIPYTETRRYVRAVTAYTAIFEWRRNRSVTPLHKRMTDVSPEPVILTRR